MYDGVLLLKLPRGVQITGFADDVLLTVIGESREEVEMLGTEAIKTVEEWMTDSKLQIAHQKTEMVLVSNCKVVEQAKITVGEHSICSKRELKYLGVILDDRLNFKSHVRYACEKAAKVATGMARIMPNNAGSCSSKRRLLASVSTSILRYGGPVWVAALEVRQNRTLLNRTLRVMAMRVASAYRTISAEAVCVIAGMIPIDIILVEDSVRYEEKTTDVLNNRELRKRTRLESIRKWQLVWNNTPNGRWTHRLIPNIAKWIERKHGEVNFHLTQFLSGHGCFRRYLNRFGHANSPFCPECGQAEETAEHVVFECPRFVQQRRELTGACGPNLNADNIVHEMCKSENSWNAANSVIVAIMTELQRKWRADQRMSARNTEQ